MVSGEGMMSVDLGIMRANAVYASDAAVNGSQFGTLLTPIFPLTSPSCTETPLPGAG